MVRTAHSALGPLVRFVVVGVVLGGCGDDTVVLSTICESDAMCDDGRFCNGIEVCDPTSPSADIFGCATTARPCMEGQICAEVAQACETICAVTTDADGDGVEAVECGGSDCDDSDRRRAPGNLELCDDAGLDEDCLEETFGTLDADGDGEVSDRCFNVRSDGTEVRGTDCNDGRANVSPGADEVCDEVDNDCDATIDEGVDEAGFSDEDGDGDGDPAAPRRGCPSSARFSTRGTDCDDADLTRSGLQVEFCDAVDNDCDGTVDENPRSVPWYPDEDGDLYGNNRTPADEIIVSCAPIPGRSVLPADCDDGARLINPTVREACNGLDDDCNGTLDGLTPAGDGEDDDADGAADIACLVGGTDCDDNSGFAGPDGVPEFCEDRIDNDCDGVVDEVAPPTDWYPDADGDLYATGMGMAVSDCRRLPGRAFRVGDCDDSDRARNPGAADGCNQIDDDCDGAIDEAAIPRRAFYSDADGDGVGTIDEIVFACGDAPRGFSEAIGDCLPTDPTVGARYEDVDGDGFGGALLSMCMSGEDGTSVPGDCDDMNDQVGPAAAEVCDGVDNDCDGRTDENGRDGCPPGNLWDCVAGACVLMDATCLLSFADCDGNPSNGCEADTAASPDDCGRCGRRCGSGQTCTAATCEGTVEDIVRGDGHVCVRRSTGSVVCWGSFESTQFFSPGSQVQGIGAIDDMWAGRGEHCYRAGAIVYCGGWSGVNRAGELGLGFASTGMAMPVPLTARPTMGITQLGLSPGHSCAIRPSRAVECSGLNTQGQLGDGTLVGRATLVPVTGLTEVTDVAVGEGHSCAVRMNGEVRCWGSNRSRQVADTPPIRHPLPVVVGLANTSADPAVEVVTGLSHSCALRASGTVECWGSGNFLGDNLPASNVGPNPVVTASGPLPPVRAVATGPNASHTCALLRTGEVYCWGMNNVGQLGNGTTSSVATDFAVPVPGIAGATAIAAGGASSSTGGSCAVTPTGVFCWGGNPNGEVGIGTSSMRETMPRRVIDLDPDSL
ncbi:MAG: MopE-related protein [Myxococcota bacterium]